MYILTSDKSGAASQSQIELSMLMSENKILIAYNRLVN